MLREEIEKAQTEPLGSEEGGKVDLSGESESPGWDSYATLLECVQSGVKQKAARVPLQTKHAPSGDVCTECLHFCDKPECYWLSRSAAEQRRHQVCHHAPEPLTSIRQKIAAKAEALPEKRKKVPKLDVKDMFKDANQHGPFKVGPIRKPGLP